MESGTKQAASVPSVEGSENPTWNGKVAGEWLGRLIENGALRRGRAMVPSARMTDEILTLARAGWHVTVVDSDREAMRQLKSTARAENLSLDLLEKDVFRTRAAFFGSLDLVVDRLLLPSLDPVRRADWGFFVARFLTKDGNLAGLFPVSRNHAGPPFPITVEELRRELDRLFVVETLEPAGPAHPGEIQGWKGLFRRK